MISSHLLRSLAIVATVICGSVAPWPTSSGGGVHGAIEPRGSSASPTSQDVRHGAEAQELRRRVQPGIEKGLRFLAGRQKDDGGWHMQPKGAEVGVTALVVKCFLQDAHYGPQHAVSRRGLRFLLDNQQEDGGIYPKGSPFAMYSTSVALMALASAKDPALAGPIKAAQEFCRGNQWSEGQKDNKGKEIDSGHAWYGGAGYGGGKRPDLSNTQMMLEALHESGLPPSDPVYQKALVFIQRCQMNSQTNDQPFARGAADGGFIYTPANGGESKAGTVKVGGRTFLRSYGSMTYAGFKSMLYADVDRHDARVQAAWGWIRRYYTLEENPNMPGAHSKEGLFYFYHVFARALRAWGEPFIIDERGQRHDWRAELADRLLSLQNREGSWVNEKDRWYEGNPDLVTAYAILALQTILE